MEWFWTWEGKCFGHREGDDLWTYQGRHVGHFHGSDVYGVDGRYLGEIRDGRLITKKGKHCWRRVGFNPQPKRIGFVKRCDYVAYVLYFGYQDFPAPEDFCFH